MTTQKQEDPFCAERHCKTCGRQFRIKRSEIRRGRKGIFCSRDCSAISQSKKVNLVCPVCGIEFTRAPSMVRGGVCSMKCRYVKQPYGVDVRDGVKIALIKLRSSRDVTSYAVVDLEDAADLSRWTWHMNASGYAQRSVKRRSEGYRCNISMHRQILGLSPGDGTEVDHINRDRLDNRRSNLRVVPKWGNRQNVTGGRGTSKYRGVCLHAPSGKWVAYVGAGGRKHNLGYFSTEEEAARVAQEGRQRLLPYATD